VESCRCNIAMRGSESEDGREGNDQQCVYQSIFCLCHSWCAVSVRAALLSLSFLVHLLWSTASLSVYGCCGIGRRAEGGSCGESCEHVDSRLLCAAIVTMSLDLRGSPTSLCLAVGMVLIL